MENTQNIDYAARVLNIYEKMKDIPSWKSINDLYKILEKKYEHELNDFPSSYDAFYKQLKGKGSKKHFKLYFDYLMSREDVKLTFSKTTNKLISNILSSVIIIILLGILIYDIKYDLFENIKNSQTQEYKQCMKKCLKLPK